MWSFQCELKFNIKLENERNIRETNLPYIWQTIRRILKLYKNNEFSSWNWKYNELDKIKIDKNIITVLILTPRSVIMSKIIK